MKRMLLPLALLLGLSFPVAQAAPAAKAVASQPAQAAAGDKKRGEEIASKGAGAAPACFSCHGPLGHGVADFPHLAGQGQQYLREQLDQFKSGSRVNNVMQPIAAALSDADKQAVTAYFSSLAPVAVTVKPAAPEALKANTGEWLSARGDFARGIPACSACHGAQGRGVGTAFPMLAGLSATYITQQLEAWQKGTRPAGTLGLMGAIAKKLTPEDTKAVSAYFAGLTVAAPAATAKSAASGTASTPGASK